MKKINSNRALVKFNKIVMHCVDVDKDGNQITKDIVNRHPSFDKSIKKNRKTGFAKKINEEVHKNININWDNILDMYNSNK